MAVVDILISGVGIVVIYGVWPYLVFCNMVSCQISFSMLVKLGHALYIMGPVMPLLPPWYLLLQYGASHDRWRCNMVPCQMSFGMLVKVGHAIMSFSTVYHWASHAYVTTMVLTVAIWGQP